MTQVCELIALTSYQGTPIHFIQLPQVPPQCLFSLFKLPLNVQ